MKERVTFPQEIISEAGFIFNAPTEYGQAVVEGKWNDDAKKAILSYIEDLNNSSGNFNTETAKIILGQSTERVGIKMGKIMQALRVAITGQGYGPDLMLTMEILGKDETVSRLKKAIEVLG